jgi:hypothetical protein
LRAEVVLTASRELEVMNWVGLEMTALVLFVLQHHFITLKPKHQMTIKASLSDACTWRKEEDFFTINTYVVGPK